MKHAHAARVPLEEVVAERDDAHDGCWRSGEAEPGEALYERSDENGGQMAAGQNIRSLGRLADISERVTHVEERKVSSIRRKRGR